MESLLAGLVHGSSSAGRDQVLDNAVEDRDRNMGDRKIHDGQYQGLLKDFELQGNDGLLMALMSS